MAYPFTIWKMIYFLDGLSIGLRAVICARQNIIIKCDEFNYNLIIKWAMRFMWNTFYRVT